PRLGGAGLGAYRRERPLDAGPGSEAVRGAGAGPVDRRGPGRRHPGGDRASRPVRASGDEGAAVRLRHRSAGGHLPALQLRAQFGGVHRDARQRYERWLVQRLRVAPAFAGAVREGAARRSRLSGLRQRRARHPLADDPRGLVVGGESRHRSGAGPARPGLRGAHEPAGHVLGQLGMAARRPVARRRARAAGRADPDLREDRAVKRKPWETRRGQLREDPQWYKDAIIYELRVRSFMDSNGDGIGDFPGLTARLDYLQDLGVSALWLLPICPSPGKDDGYDISDYTDVHPDV